MKKLFLAVIGLAAFVAGNAQTVSLDSGDNKAYLGVRVSGDILNPGDLEMKDGNTGITANIDALKVGGGIEFGAIYNQPIFMNLYVEPGLSFYYNSYGIQKNYVDLFKSEEIDVNKNAKGGSIRRFGMRIPVLVGYHFDFSDELKVHVFTGPEFEMAFYGQSCIGYNHTSVRQDMFCKVEEGGRYNRFDMLWDFGAGVTWKQYYFGLKGGVGMCNMSKVSGVKLHENRVSLTVGYNFSL